MYESPFKLWMTLSEALGGIRKRDISHADSACHVIRDIYVLALDMVWDRYDASAIKSLGSQKRDLHRLPAAWRRVVNVDWEPIYYPNDVPYAGGTMRQRIVRLLVSLLREGFGPMGTFEKTSTLHVEVAKQFLADQEADFGLTCSVMADALEDKDYRVEPVLQWLRSPHRKCIDISWAIDVLMNRSPLQPQ